MGFEPAHQIIEDLAVDLPVPVLIALGARRPVGGLQQVIDVLVDEQLGALSSAAVDRTDQRLRIGPPGYLEVVHALHDCDRLIERRHQFDERRSRGVPSDRLAQDDRPPRWRQIRLWVLSPPAKSRLEGRPSSGDVASFFGHPTLGEHLRRRSSRRGEQDNASQVFLRRDGHRFVGPEAVTDDEDRV